MLTLQQIDSLCDEFAHKWLTDNSLSIEGFIGSITVSHGKPLVNELIIQDVELRFSTGLCPDRSEYEQRFPNHSNAIELAFRRLESDSLSVLEQVLTVVDLAGDQAVLGAIEENRIPQRLGDFEITARIGSGAFGIVFRGRNLITGENVALKFPRSRTLESLTEFQQFCNEAKLARSLSHPAIVKSFGLRGEEGFVFIVQQFVEGGTLKQSRVQFESTESIVKLIATIADAIAYAHRCGLIHRDLKPSNVLIDPSGNPLIADFGLSVHESFQKRLRGQRCGTPAYMSPEQVMGLTHQLDGRSDIWSLGVILYELLANERPFRGACVDEIYEEVKLRNEKPLRMIRPDLDRELQRICLKCLSKSIRDRFPSADELAQDLKNWLAYRDQWQSKSYVPLVPRGLRPFGAEDAEAFVELLPGPRNSLGVPECIQFWKTKLESFITEGELPIGLIFGPSGSGKSSYVRAGLIPRLDSGLIAATYVEATAEDTEVRLIKSLRHRFADIPGDVSLPEMVNGIRNGIWSGNSRRTLIVLDQFEQWIHGRSRFEDSQLAQALRHCDGVNISCLLLIRDEYWLSTSRFMAHLGFDMHEGKNAQRIDRFEKAHAIDVLFLIGRALKKLPEQQAELSKQQIRLLKKVIDDLAEDDRVACVHLTLFAEMFKNRDWSLKELQSIGGVSAVGTRFLEETFESKFTPAYLRRIKPDAQIILEQLLPDSGVNLKGHMQRLEILTDAAGEESESTRIERAVGILNDELRLIVQTEPDRSKVDGSENMPATGPKHYQLTHDYLVPSIRNWLERDRKKTWRGRAELKLAELSGQWKTEHAARFLPSLADYAKIKLGVPPKKQTERQKAFMKSAGQMHLLRSAAIFAIAVVVSLVIAGYRTKAGQHKAAELVLTYLTGPSKVASDRLDSLESHRELAVKILRQHVSSGNQETLLRAALGLGRLDFESEDSLGIAIEAMKNMADDQEFAFVAQELRQHKRSYGLIKSQFDCTDLLECRSRLAVMAMCLDEYAIAETIFDKEQDQTEASTVERFYEDWLESLTNINDQAEAANRILDKCEVARPNLLFHLLVSVRDLNIEKWDSGTKIRWQEFIKDSYVTHPDGGIHGVCFMLAKRWNITLKTIPSDTSLPKKRDWLHLDIGDGLQMTFVRICPGPYVRGHGSLPPNTIEERYFPHETVIIADEFWMATTEVPIALQRLWRASQIDNDSSQLQKTTPIADNLLDAKRSEFGLSYNEAEQMIKWADSVAEFSKDYQLIVPSNDQWEFACRANSETMFPWGDVRVENQLSKFAVVAASQFELGTKVISSSGGKVPNRFGLFDMIGNVSEYARQTEREKSIQNEWEASRQVEQEGLSKVVPIAFIKGGGTTHNSTLYSGYVIAMPASRNDWRCGIRMILEKSDPPANTMTE